MSGTHWDRNKKYGGGVLSTRTLTPNFVSLVPGKSDRGGEGGAGGGCHT